MKLSKKYKIEEAASKDSSRPSINHIEITTHNDKPVAVATDGRMLAIVPVEMAEDDKPGMITVEALKRSRKFQKRVASRRSFRYRRNEPDQIIPEDIKLSETDVVFPDRASLPRPAIGETRPYPDWTKVVPDGKEHTTFKIGLNPSLLYKLAKAMGAGDGGVSILCKSPDEPMIVRAERDPDALGILMPMRIHIPEPNIP